MNYPVKITNNSPATSFINPFQTFWMGGYECTDKLNAYGHRVDFLHVTGHFEMIDQDYQLLKPFNIGSVREGIRWSHIEKTPYQYDWSTVGQMMDRGKANGIQQIWDICHFGFPDDLTPLHPLFSIRFSALCRAFVKFYRSKDPDSTLIVTPINEVSFLSWLGGDARGTSPYCWGQGWEVKYNLMRAYIEGVAALRETDPSIRILTTEPLVQMVPPLHATEEQIINAQHAHDHQFQSVDMLAGRLCPELGGSPDYLDILGYNFYYNNQWVNGTHQFLPWANIPNDSRWLPLRDLLVQAYCRYNRPIALTETSHSGIDRPNWIEYVGRECAAVIEMGVPFWGVCLYPIIDRPDWDHLHPWHGSGLWDAEMKAIGPPGRKLNEPYAEA
ncbi:MAG: amine oxidase, partial [Chitinophagaceae bacterium]